MARATKEQVDKHIEWAIYGGAPLGAYELAKEVLALRAELAECERNRQLASDAHEAAELRIVELREEPAQLREELAKVDRSLGSLGIKLSNAQEESRKATFAAQLNARQRDEARATIERVEALRSYFNAGDGAEETHDGRGIALRIDRALRGEP